MSGLPSRLQKILEMRLGVRIHDARPLAGGCIANATRLVTSSCVYFMKWSGEEAGETFHAEAEGLRALLQAGTRLRIPNVVEVAPPQDGRPGYLVLEYVEEGPESDDHWRELGLDLAELHRFEGDRYGFHTDNFIGRLPQSNDARATWPEFFIDQRIGVQVAMARSRGRWHGQWDVPLDHLLTRIDEILPQTPPRSLLHGDLWRGNVLADRRGVPVLIDPAVYYGHRETDLAMAELFGGFSSRFFDAYESAWPLEPGYVDRRPIYQLYHLLNHLNIFGDGYAGSVDRILKRWM